MREDNSAYDGCRDGFEVFLQNDVDAVSRQNFDAGAESRLGKGVSVRANVERSLNLFGSAVFVDSLRDSKDMLFVETAEFGAASVP